ncbi:hypothetical protein BgiMline_028402 [Biomphalaria glabrata]|uniref:Uncharacterized protein LOC106074488 isoform X1 n=1 Tax=Biomphalaria glabrata TaxID=6526 RepID=A0A9W2YER4_BIOGL|nr:uncharacterized protein LOC106074488 isoform X1 [Biomphalaria glabrata]KAI8749097.1 BICD family cargo adapter 1 isoform X4 [Biomphalaria glabrata]KAI8753652.1 BICD family-like cargo adapter 1 isoform X4 [Biomphalaria glabrata]
MAEKHKIPSDNTDLTGDIMADVDEDVYAQLAQKERDLILAAELGKALLDSNQELQLRYDHAVDDFTHKIEGLQQEKHDLHLELEKMETEYQNALKDLQDDIASLRKQIQAKDELSITERERSRTIREAQLNSDYYLDEIKKASKREEELIEELSGQREKMESSAATIKDQMDHINMLRDQVEYLNDKLKKANQKLSEVQGERDALTTTLELAQEQIQSLELKIAQQEEKIHRQACDIEELQEANSDLQLQLDHQQHPYHRQIYARKSAPGIKNKNMNNNSAARAFQPNTLFQELNQEKLNQNHQEKTCAQNSTEDELKQCPLPLASEMSLLAEIKSAQPLNVPPLSTELAHCHSRNASNCSLSSLTEGSRKRHHQNIGNNSDEDSETDTLKINRNFGCKQTLYAPAQSYQLAFSSNGCVPESSLDNNGNGILLVKSSNIFNKENTASLAAELFQQPHSAFDECDILSESSSKCSTPEDISKPLFDGKAFENHSTKALDSAMSHSIQQEMSLFSELSSQMYEDKSGSGSDLSSNCMLGVFDFSSGPDPILNDVDRNDSNESLNQSMEIRSHLESDLSMTSEWYYMTPVTTEMLEDDDFECDDDDFLVGNMAGTTLSIGDSRTGLNYLYQVNKKTEEDSTAVDPPVDNKDILRDYAEPEECSPEKQQRQLTEACLQLRDLVIRMQGQCDLRTDLEKRSVTTEDLLSLVAQMKICVDNITAAETDDNKNKNNTSQLHETSQLKLQTAS